MGSWPYLQYQVEQVFSPIRKCWLPYNIDFTVYPWAFLAMLAITVVHSVHSWIRELLTFSPKSLPNTFQYNESYLGGLRFSNTKLICLYFVNNVVSSEIKPFYWVQNDYLLRIYFLGLLKDLGQRCVSSNSSIAFRPKTHIPSDIIPHTFI